MNPSSQLFLFLLNIYFNLGIIGPLVQQQKDSFYSSMAPELILMPEAHESVYFEHAIDNLMMDYVKKLKQIRDTKSDAEAIALVNNAKIVLKQRTEKLAPQVKAWKHSLSAHEAKQFTDNLLVKPYFKEINKIVLNYSFSSRLDNNEELKSAFGELNGFFLVLYN
jgi:hypothetical protein